ncbi:hypothetical protein B0H66DRAFT_39532 [Apodospora peruviana]|uniref:Chromo domain-containing protein n=1 Tax=Apodospora peruviana TaxID=516989 RepID=A0AAE0MEQ9_9PEZI|nr:hypothetical protein B0H66DRAFT_39532 [Apodospora peruviana]
MDGGEKTLARLKTKIEIPLPSYRRYVRGSGPPSQPITLAPVRDSTAYIIDRFVLPSAADIKPGYGRMIHYHVGFTDDPALKVLLPADKVLDYVSPRELEDWEYSNYERLEAERAEDARKLSEEKKPGRPVKVGGRIGRPPLAPQPDAPNTTTTSAAQTPSDPEQDHLDLDNQVAGPSLSIPQKRKLEHIVDDQNDLDTGEETGSVQDSDEAIRRQLYDEVEDSERETVVPETSGFKPIPTAHQPSAQALSVTDQSSRASSFTPYSHPMTSAPNPQIKSTPKQPPARVLHSASVTSTAKIHPAWAKSMGLENGSDSPLNIQTLNCNSTILPSGGVANRKTVGPRSSQSTTSIPLPAYALAAATAMSTTGGSARPRSRPQTQTPRLLTPTVETGSDSALSKRKSKKQPKSQPKEKKQKTIKTKKTLPDGEDEEEVPENVWVVKELLDDQWTYENGIKVHKYLVNWAGDWPPDQNPTWEPAENIEDADLITVYQRKKKAGLLKPAKAQRNLLSFLANKRYSNVAEAFEDGIEEAHARHARMESPAADEGEGELLAVTDPATVTTAGTKPRLHPLFQTFDAKLQQYNRAFPPAA